jgi:hypothetical protein
MQTAAKRFVTDWAAGERRVYKPEVRAATGWGDTWLRQQILVGNWPKPHCDPGCKRSWWREAEVREALTKLNRRAVADGSQ